MAIEGGARCGYVNPRCTTFAYLCHGRPMAPRRATGSGRWLGGKAWPAGPGAPLRRQRCVRCLGPGAHASPGGSPPRQGIGIDEAVPTPEQLLTQRAPPVASRLTSTWTSPRGLLIWPRSTCGCLLHRQLHQRSASVICAPPCGRGPGANGGQRNQGFCWCLSSSRWPAPPEKPKEARSGLPRAGFEVARTGCPRCVCAH